VDFLLRDALLLIDAAKYPATNTSRHLRALAGAREGAWPADQVERWPIDRVIPYAKNSRTDSDAQIAQLAASMKEWGWTNPVLADEVGGVDAQKRA
jgi:hypothetical protein